MEISEAVLDELGISALDIFDSSDERSKVSIESRLVMPDLVAKLEDTSLASYSCRAIVKRIRDFEAQLDNEHEVSLQLASFGQSVVLAVSEISYSNPNMLVFSGSIDGKKATLIQYMSQLNFLLLSVPKAEPLSPPRRIGFAIPTED